MMLSGGNNISVAGYVCVCVCVCEYCIIMTVLAADERNPIIHKTKVKYMSRGIPVTVSPTLHCNRHDITLVN